MKRADLILIVIVLAASLAGFFGLRQVADVYYLEVIFDGQRVHYEPINESTNGELVIEEIGRVEIVITNGVVNVVSATANPNQICVYAAPISQTSWNPNIICAPNRLTIRIIGGSPIVDVVI
jgi:hypothetical protein